MITRTLLRFCGDCFAFGMMFAGAIGTGMVAEWMTGDIVLGIAISLLACIGVGVSAAEMVTRE